MVSAVGAAQAAQTLNAGIGSLADNYETFMTLLTAQLKNQDPLSPLDTNQFTQQLTQMTGVQQQLLTNQLLTQLLAQDKSDLAGSVMNLLGKEVTVETAHTTLKDGEANWTYALAATAASTKLEVLNAKGEVVWKGEAEKNNAGAQAFRWNGKNNAGADMPQGDYFLRVSAVDGAGRSIASSIAVTGLAAKLETVNGETLVSVGASRAPLSAVRSIAST